MRLCRTCGKRVRGAIISCSACWEWALLSVIYEAGNRPPTGDELMERTGMTTSSSVMQRHVGYLIRAGLAEKEQMLHVSAARSLCLTEAGLEALVSQAKERGLVPINGQMLALETPSIMTDLPFGLEPERAYFLGGKLHMIYQQ